MNWPAAVLSLSLSLSHTRTLSHPLAHTHTHSLSLSHSLSLRSRVRSIVKENDEDSFGRKKISLSGWKNDFEQHSIIKSVSRVSARHRIPKTDRPSATFQVSFNSMFFPSTPIESPRQDAWLTRLDPRLEIEGNLYWVPVQQVEPSCAGLCLWVPQLYASSMMPFSQLCSLLLSQGLRSSLIVLSIW